MRHSAGIRLWLIDLDDTLHDASARILPWVNQAMTQYVMQHVGVDLAQADSLRQDYWKSYGATLLGLIRHHGVSAEHFLEQTHPNAEQLQAWVKKSPSLAKRLRALPGRKVLLTNAPIAYAAVVLKARGLSNSFEAVVSIENMRIAGQLKPKPSKPMLRRLIAKLRVLPAHCALIEDSVENLRSAKALGLKTYLVHGYRKPRTRKASPYIDHRVESDLK